MTVCTLSNVTQPAAAAAAADDDDDDGNDDGGSDTCPIAGSLALRTSPRAAAVSATDSLTRCTENHLVATLS